MNAMANYDPVIIDLTRVGFVKRTQCREAIAF
jgi:hypothetical protein